MSDAKAPTDEMTRRFDRMSTTIQDPFTLDIIEDDLERYAEYERKRQDEKRTEGTTD